MPRPEPPEEFWNRPELVGAYSVGAALPYEQDLVHRGVGRSEHDAPVRCVHVVGVGAGRELPAVLSAAPAATVHAWDISPGMVEACTRRAQQEGWDRVVVHRGAVSELRRPDDVAADVVVALGAVLGYATTPQQRSIDVAALRSVLRPAGSLVAVVQQRNGRPDWSAYFALRGLLERISTNPGGVGNRSSRHGDASVRFHHYSAREMRELLDLHGFDGIEITSLRSWSSSHGSRLRLRSPNPLLVLARAADAGAKG